MDLFIYLHLHQCMNLYHMLWKVHMKHLLRKLKLRGRVEAVVWAMERLPR